jgi:thiamine-phosphate pyrophosphorylase
MRNVRIEHSTLNIDRFLYPIIDTEVCRRAGLDPIALGTIFLSGGARILQLRAKTDSSAAFLSLADSLVRLTRAADAALVVNDRADVALLSGADGVHVGQDDLTPAAVRRVYPAGIIGLSTHDKGQIDAALDTEATYVAVGPIFGTSTKNTGYTARGLELVRYAANRGKPVVAIGGITLDRVSDLIAAGASGIAVITDLLAGEDPEARTRQFVTALAEARTL